MDDCQIVCFRLKKTAIPANHSCPLGRGGDGVVARDDHPYYPWCITGLLEEAREARRLPLVFWRRRAPSADLQGMKASNWAP